MDALSPVASKMHSLVQEQLILLRHLTYAHTSVVMEPWTLQEHIRRVATMATLLMEMDVAILAQLKMLLHAQEMDQPQLIQINALTSAGMERWIAKALMPSNAMTLIP